MPKQDVSLELYYSGAWHDIAADDKVFTQAPITIQRGLGDESGGWPRPAQIMAQLDNADDMFRTSNPVSPLYGLAGRNTPMRVSVGDSIRGIVEASSWSADQTRDFRQTPRRGKAWVDVAGGGLLQRIGGWTQPLRSALYRYVDKSGITPAEWWPMEDVDGSTQAVSAVGGSPMTPVTAVRYTLPDGSPIAPGGAPDFASGAGIPGADKLPSFVQGGTLKAPIRAVTFADGYSIDWVMQFKAGTDAGGTTSADVLSWRETGTYVHFTVNVTKDFVTVFHANGADDVTLSSTGSATATVDMYDGAPHYFSYFVHQNGGNYDAGLVVDGGAVGGFAADNFATPGAMAGTVGRPTEIEWNPGEQRGDYMPIAAGALVVWQGWQEDTQVPDVFTALNGRAGELAAVRFGRLIDEELGPGNYYVSNGYADSMPMGPQRPDSLPNLIKECITTEDAFVYDLSDELRLYFLCRADRYRQTPALTLSPTDLPALPKEVDDGKTAGNIVTASQRDGGDWTARDDTGPLGTQPPPDGVGEEKQTVNVNLSDPDAELPQVANWWLRRGTVNLPRFPQLVVNVAALDADLVADLNAIRPGNVITITGFREYTIRLHVLGWTETIGTHSRSIVFNCAADQQFQVGKYDATDSRWDLRTCTLSGAHTATATTLSVAITADEAWSATSAYDLLISGELIGVPVGGAGARGGTVGAYTQTLTGVTRSKNGIRKALPSGSEVHVYNDPGRWAL